MLYQFIFFIMVIFFRALSWKKTSMKMSVTFLQLLWVNKYKITRKNIFILKTNGKYTGLNGKCRLCTRKKTLIGTQ